MDSGYWERILRSERSNAALLPQATDTRECGRSTGMMLTKTPEMYAGVGIMVMSIMSQRGLVRHDRQDESGR